MTRACRATTLSQPRVRASCSRSISLASGARKAQTNSLLVRFVALLGDVGVGQAQAAKRLS